MIRKLEWMEKYNPIQKNHWLRKTEVGKGQKMGEWQIQAESFTRALGTSAVQNKTQVKSLQLANDPLRVTLSLSQQELRKTEISKRCVHFSAQTVFRSQEQLTIFI